MAYIQDVQESVPALPEAGNLTSFVVLSQNENGRRLNFKIVGVDIPSGSTATFSGTKPDGVVYSTTGTISGNIVTVNEDIQMTAVAGSWDAKIRVLNGGNVIASAKVRMTIDADPVDPDAIPSDSQLDGIVAECQAYAESARSDAYGSPLTASTAAGMIDKTRVYVYTGSETGYTNGHWYYWDGTAWADGGTYNSSGIQTDTTLSVPGMAADAKAAGDEISDLKEELEHITGISDDVKDALLQIASKVAYIDEHGQDYYDALYNALYPPADLVSISAVYTQSGTVYDTDSLDSLKSDLVVTAHYSDQTTEAVTNYTLSGTLSEGTSTITVSYDGKTTTFTVTVTARVPSIYQKVEWIGFDGSSRIVSTATPGDDFKIEGLFDVPTTSSETCIVGLVASSTADFEIGYTQTSGRLFFYTDNSLAVTDIADLNDYPASITATYKYYGDRTLKAVVNDIEYSGMKDTGNTKSVSSSLKFTIGSGGYSSQRLGFHGKAYSANLYVAGTLVSSLVPCYRKSDGVIGMYDIVEEEFLTNAGSGTLTKGADV